MHPFRIAILIFVVGASVANYFAVRAYADRISPPSTVSESTATPLNNPLLATPLRNPFLGTPSESPKNEEPTPFAWIPVAPNPEIQGLLAEANDKAWMREAIIVTIAGVAWFLLRPPVLPPSLVV